MSRTINHIQYIHICINTFDQLFNCYNHRTCSPLSLRHIVDTIGHQYEYIWYIDSDATVSPLHTNISIEQKILSWETESSIDEIQQQGNGEGSSYEVRLSSTVNKRQRSSKGRVAYGNKKVSQSAFIFFNNHPWRDGEHICMYVCIYVYVQEDNFVLMYVSCMNASMYVCTYVCIYVYVCMYVCM